MKNKLVAFLLLSIVVFNCKEEKNTQDQEEEKRTTVEMVTTKGTMLIELYNETPKHRDNFIKLANEGVFDSLLFHRVIEEFMVQAGDINSKYAEANDTLGSGDLDYKVDAEFHPNLFHKRGVLAAARDGNPERASSSTQFYIVHRGPRNDSLLNVDQERINGWLAEHYMQKDSAYVALFKARNDAIENRDREAFTLLNDSIRNLTKTYDGFERYVIPEAHREVYRTVGGTAHLDQNYTVYGEVIKGIEVVDSIAKVATNPLDRPVEDVRILSVKVLDNQ